MQFAGHASQLSRLPTIDEILSRPGPPVPPKGPDLSRLSHNNPIWQTNYKRSQSTGPRTNSRHLMPVDIKNPKPKPRRHTAVAYTKMEQERESVIELARFLRTRPPPSDNYMSLPDTSRSSIPDTKSALKIFRRPSQKKGSGPAPRTLKLPDSAVAAKTIQGHWHIAISIPVEHEYTNAQSTSQHQSSKEAAVTSNSRGQKGPITVIKPVIPIVRPKSLDGANGVLHPINASLQAPAKSSDATTPDRDTTEALNVWPLRQDSLEPTVNPTKDDKVTKSPSRLPQRNNKPESTQGLSRQNSQKSVGRQSIVTSFSRGSLESKTGHSRGQSSVSTAPSLKYPTSLKGTESPLKTSVRPMLRKITGTSETTSSRPTSADGSLEFETGHSRGQSSVSTAPSIKYPTSVPGAESLWKTTHPPRLSKTTDPVENPSLRPRSAEASFDEAASEFLAVVRDSNTDSVISNISSAIESVAETAKGYGPSDVASPQITSIRKASRMPGPAPTRKLPDLPEGGNDGQSAVSRSSSVSVGKADEKPPSQWPIFRSTLRNELPKGDESEVDVTPATHQSRRERVRALRSRDMAQLRATSKYLQVIASVAAQGNSIGYTPLLTEETRTKPSPRQLKRRSLSYPPIVKEVAYQDAALNLTPIMLVANVEPPSNPGGVKIPLINQKSYETKDGRGSRKSKAVRPHNKTGTVTPSLASSDEEYLHAPRRRSRTTSGSRSTSSGMSAHHLAAALRRNRSLQEASLDSRLRKLEESNAMMLQTLNAVVEIGSDFRELHRLWLANPISAHDVELRESLTDQIEKGLANVEPLMRELTNGTKTKSDVFGEEPEQEVYDEYET